MGPGGLGIHPGGGGIDTIGRGSGADGAGTISQGDLDNAISTTARNPGVAPLGLTVSNPPTQTQMQQIADKMDELIAALAR